MILRQRSSRRRGLSLLEVIIAMAIFLLSLVVISQMIESGAQRGVRAQRQSKAALLAESRMAELVAGVIPLDFTPDELGGAEHELPLDPEDEPNENWRCFVRVDYPPYDIEILAPYDEDADVAGLMLVTVRVGYYPFGGESAEVEYSLSRLMMNSTLRIPLPDPPKPTTAAGAMSRQ